MAGCHSAYNAWGSIFYISCRYVPHPPLAQKSSYRVSAGWSIHAYQTSPLFSSEANSHLFPLQAQGNIFYFPPGMRLHTQVNPTPFTRHTASSQLLFPQGQRREKHWHSCPVPLIQARLLQLKLRNVLKILSLRSPAFHSPFGVAVYSISGEASGSKGFVLMASEKR